MSIDSVVVIGAGAWGTALATVLARAGTATLLWDNDAALIEHLARARRHPTLTIAAQIESSIKPISELGRADCARCAVMAVPFQVLSQAAAKVGEALPGLLGVACASKGIETGTHRIAHEIIASVMGDDMPFAQLSGPNFAAEVIAGRPSAMTVGVADVEFGRELVAAVHGRTFRPYLSDDLVGVQIGGALKNVIAIAAGIADGLGLGANTRAALITRGLAEMARLGVARGGRMETFMGLSGMGDLVLTCTDDQSRNRRFGIALARHGAVERAKQEVGALVEGVPTALAVVEMANNCKVDMPIAFEVARVLKGECAPGDAVTSLLSRDPVAEIA